MKKRIFALALALCMMVSVMPNSFAAGILSVSDGTSTDTTVPSGGSILSVTGSPPTQLSNTGALQNSILSNSSSAQPLDDSTGETGEEPTGGENNGTLNGGTGSTTTGDILGGDGTTGGGSTGDSTPADLVTNTQGLELSKNVSGNKITLEAFVTGQTVTSTQTTTKPLDIILVLDTSREMVTRTSGVANSYEYLYNMQENDTQFYNANGDAVVIEREKRSAIIIGSYYVYRIGSSGDWHNSYDRTTLYTSANSSDGGNTRLGALKTAAKTFINTVAAQEFATGVTPTRIAVVEYHDTAAVLSGTETAVEGALVVIDDDGAEQLNGIIDELTVKANSAAANCNLGLAAAKNIFQSANNGEFKDRDRVVILLSAGVFGSRGDLEGTDRDIAMDVINLGVILKMPRGYDALEDTGYKPSADSPFVYGIDVDSDFYLGKSFENNETYFKATYGSSFAGCGATIYCVGLGMPAGSSSSYGQIGNRINEVMYRLSSHRPDGTHVERGHYYNSWETEAWTGYYTDARTRNHTNGYFLTADNATSLNTIFQSISSNVTSGGASISTLTSSTIVQDVISPYFQIPVGGKVTAHTETYDGMEGDKRTWKIGEDDTSWALKPVGNTVQATGFDFSANYVGDDTVGNSVEPHGKKLVIEIDIAPNADFLGGNDVPTNDDAQAGVFNANKELIENFRNDNAATDIPVKEINPGVANQNIYLSNEAALKALLKKDGQDERINGTNNKYVDIIYTIIDEDNEPVGTYTIPMGGTINSGTWALADADADWTPVLDDDATYTITCKVDAGSGKSITSKPVAATVSVFKPQITFADSTIYLGEVPTYLGTNYTADSIAWVNGSIDSNAVTMRDKAPVATITLDPATSAFAECTPVNVTAVTLGTTYDAALSDVTFKNGTSVHAGDAKDVEEFMVHVLYPSVDYVPSTVQLGYAPGETYYKANNLVKTDEGKTIVTWADKHDDHGISSVTNNADSNFTYSFTPEDTSLTDCTSVKAAIAIKVNNVDVTADTDVFTVHVVRPTITFADQVIHLSKQPDYIDLSDTDEAKAFAWDSGCAWAHTDIPAVTGAVAVTDFSLDYTENDHSFLNCTDVNVKVMFGEDDYTAYVTLKNTDGSTRNTIEKPTEFTVHVLKPDFTVAVTDLHADYGTPVGLDHLNTDINQTVQAVNCSYAWKCATADCDEVKTVSNLTGESVAIGQVLYSITCDSTDDKALTKDDESNQWTYLVNETDTTFTVDVTGFKIGTTAYNDDAHRAGVMFTNEDSEFVIYTNKFDLTISKEWKDGEKAADGTYKQDAIFTVSGGLGEFQVVLPKGESNVIVTGLLCGQDYTVTEDTNWTWRWKANVNADGKEIVTLNVTECGDHNVTTFNPHDTTDDKSNPDARGAKPIEFINSLFNRLWLSFCTTVKNIFAAITTTEGGN